MALVKEVVVSELRKNLNKIKEKLAKNPKKCSWPPIQLLLGRLISKAIKNNEIILGLDALSLFEQDILKRGICASEAQIYEILHTLKENGLNPNKYFLGKDSLIMKKLSEYQIEQNKKEGGFMKKLKEKAKMAKK